MFTALIDDNIATLEQAQTLLRQISQNQRVTTTQIGPHLRHILDHYDCFLDGLESGHINYDERERDSTTEQCIATAQQRIARIIARLSERRLAALPARLSVKLATNADTSGANSWSSSERELQFLQSHTVHHFALIRVYLEHQGIALDADFGKAPSTVRYERASA